MCVTNLVKRQPRAIPPNVDVSSMMAKTPSLISQRLMGSFMPMMMNSSSSESVSTISTANPVEAPRVPQQFTIPAHFNSSSYFSQQHNEKPRPKRRRKPQKPGKTAKQNDRHFVVHNYHDHASDPDENDVTEEDIHARRRGGVSVSFPMKLHAILDQVEADGLGHIMSWQPHGRCFAIHMPKEFTELVMPNYFRQSKLTSFQRQLNLYGFQRLTKGKDTGGYYHELFLRGKAFLTKRMQRTKIKGTKFKAASSPEQEPDFYAMAPVLVTPMHSSDDSSAEGDRPTRTVARKRGLDLNFSAVPEATSFMDPLPLQIPRPNPVDSYPMLTTQTPSFVPNNNSIMMSSNYVTSLGFGQGIDDALDDAVDELFTNDPTMGDISRLGEMWDGSELEEENVQDDLQLGYLLEKLLEG